MRRFAALAVLILVFAGLLPVQAQTVFNTGVWQFESYIADMIYSGTWSTSAPSNTTLRTTTTASSSVSFLVQGKVMMLHHYMYPASTGSQFQVCIGASCSTITATTGATIGLWYGTSFPLAAGTNTITITRVSGTVGLDYIMILDDPSGTFPTPVPTATIIPSSTPASTTTPQPTPTAQPSSTPVSYVWALNPAAQYGNANGQITSTEYSATAADVHLSNLLMLLIFSVWGMFFFVVFQVRMNKR